MSYEFGHCGPGELGDLVELANRVFRVRRPGDMGEEYPLVFEPQNLENLRVARSDGRIVAHVGLCIRDAAILGAQLRVASIGAVATDPEHRGHGIASRLMADAKAHAVSQGASLMLISGLRGLYHRLGYVEVGDFRCFSIPAGSPDPALAVDPLEDADLPAVVRLHQQEAVRFFRPLDDWHKLLAAGYLMNHPAELLVIREAGRVVAFAGVQRPESPAPGSPLMVKEIAGSRAALARALPGIPARDGAAAVEVVTSGSDDAWNGLAAENGWAGSPTAFPGTLGIIDVPRFLGAIAPLLEERCGDELRITTSGDGARLTAGGQSAVLENAALLTALVFGGETAEARSVPELPAGLAEVVGCVFPLPLLWYGYNYV
jgi:predicted N-acetyltransferase YhbS